MQVRMQGFWALGLGHRGAQSSASVSCALSHVPQLWVRGGKWRQWTDEKRWSLACNAFQRHTQMVPRGSICVPQWVWRGPGAVCRDKEACALQTPPCAGIRRSSKGRVRGHWSEGVTAGGGDSHGHSLLCPETLGSQVSKWSSRIGPFSLSSSPGAGR